MPLKERSSMFLCRLVLVSAPRPHWFINGGWLRVFDHSAGRTSRNRQTGGEDGTRQISGVELYLATSNRPSRFTIVFRNNQPPHKISSRQRIQTIGLIEQVRLRQCHSLQHVHAGCITASHGCRATSLPLQLVNYKTSAIS